ncbi:MAG: TIGR00282 family metallophosphoesterase [Pseudomonadota bacterium]
MRLLFCGDVMGRSGRDVVIAELPGLRERLGIDFTVVNGENAAHGFGMTAGICEDLFAAGADVITGGNHTFDRAEIIQTMETDRRMLRPANYPPGTPGRGVGEYEAVPGRKVKVINVMTRLFMELLDDPFAALKAELPLGTPKSSGFDAIIVDVHGEATSEKMALGHIADGHASLVVGTHTHVPTADARLFPGGTAYQTDAGMCGDYNSVIGMKAELSIRTFERRFPRERMAPADGPGTLCGTFVETDAKTGLATRVEPVRIGGTLPSYIPNVD